jgi:hypothetical protein
MGEWSTSVSAKLPKRKRVVPVFESVVPTIRSAPERLP